MSITFDSPMERRCEATIHFSDPSFLPMSYSFASVPCDGLQINVFTIPNGVPNGDADVIWQCAGLAPTCNHAVISGGLADVSIPLDNEGLVGCLLEDLQTRTTLVTLTRSSGTFVETAPTVLTTSTTSFLSATTNTVDKDKTESPSTNIEAFSTTKTRTKTTKTKTGQASTPEAETRTLKHPETINTISRTSTLPGHTVDATEGAVDSASASTAVSTSTSTRSDSEDDVSVSSASRTTMSLSAVKVSILSTLTIIQTVTARCSSG
ncbi:hypothetical protein EDB81DRAFT_906164 [Dactylonectria macrodidyma]|uniref:Uncharacterized protein n=1 Tax=Dactylonectria macrodidyma TaxID=307937 RepID=A0A9P9IU49_9HYPO|nr:hypothetical protein EDB81DRAFT_906164 [Dactylonectria macrodidyma]